jgi:hypothetical protein
VARANATDDASLRHFGAPVASCGVGGTIPFMGMLGEPLPDAQPARRRARPRLERPRSRRVPRPADRPTRHRIRRRRAAGTCGARLVIGERHPRHRGRAGGSRPAATRVSVTLAAVAEPHELDELRETLRHIWGPEVVPPRNLLRGMALGGSCLLVARQDDRAVGFALGWLGWAGGVHLHSHQVGVIPELRAAGVGYALKLASAPRPWRHGITEMRWTYDPMLFTNARFNLVRLGRRSWRSTRTATATDRTRSTPVTARTASRCRGDSTARSSAQLRRWPRRRTSSSSCPGLPRPPR